MKAVTIADGKLVVAERPDPVPGAGEVLVRVRAAGLNQADQLQVLGFYPAPPGSPPDIPGLELAGEVVEVGPSVLRFTTGDRVLAVVGGGAQAELAVVHERVAMPMPEGLDWVQGGAIPEACATAHDALFTQCGLGMSERVLISGGAGGVGTAAVILAAEAGARVTATVRNPDRRDAVAALGADAIAPEALESHGPYDVILELIGAPNMAANLRALATGGRISVIGVGGGAAAEIDLLGLMAKRASIRGSTLRARDLEEKAMVARAVEAHVLPLFEAGLRGPNAEPGLRGPNAEPGLRGPNVEPGLRGPNVEPGLRGPNVEHGRRQVPIAATYPLDAAVEAYAHYAAGGKLGKIVLTA